MSHDTARRFVLVITTGNDAMSTWEDVASALKSVRESIVLTHLRDSRGLAVESDAEPTPGESGPIWDANGNRVGSWHVDEEEV